MARILDWQHLTGRAIDAIPREHAIVLVTSSPLEVHGPHLPTITDICEAEALATRVARRLGDREPDLVFLRLPPIYVATDALPHVGSLKFRQGTITRVFEDLGRSLCAQGFRDIWVSGFHGGPRHFTSLDVAAERVNRRHGGRMISTFSLMMNVLTSGRTDMSALLGRVEGVGPEHLDGDAHGGCVETSIMLALLGEHVDPAWKELGPNTVDLWLARRGLPPLALGERPSLRQLARSLREKLKFYEAETWSGNPSLASPELGERFLEVLTDLAAGALADVRAGRRSLDDCRSPVWGARHVFVSEWITDGFERLMDYRNRVW
jgi:creatinine amidohydrolase